MFFRRELSNRLRIRADEVDLSDKAKDTVFTGSYLIPRKIVGAVAVFNDDPDTKMLYPYALNVAWRRGNGGREVTDGYIHREAYDDVAEEMNDPRALRRANHIERVARRVKIAAITLGLSGVAVGLGLSGHGANHDPNSITGCATTVATMPEQVTQPGRDIIAESICRLSGQSAPEPVTVEPAACLTPIC